MSNVNGCERSAIKLELPELSSCLKSRKSPNRQTAPTTLLAIIHMHRAGWEMGEVAGGWQP